MVHVMAKAKNVNEDFFKHWTANMAYLLGFLLADGTFDITNRGGYYFGFHICDKDLLVSLRKVLGSTHKISERKVKIGELPRYRLQIGSKTMCQDLLNLGVVPQKTKQLTIPLIPHQFVFDFIRGYFDGDGNVWSGTINNKRVTPTHVLQVTFTSGSCPFLFALRSLLNENGIKGGAVYLPKNKQFGRLTFSTVSALLLASNMYVDQPKLYLSRKKEKLDDFISTYNS